ncbi:MAG: hypothetical protein HZA77_02160 [Candidatus Schekmanbacteria bacterium]|nr:hypothetical protein [Candidatus Schekmanbacteria bacterium]
MVYFQNERKKQNTWFLILTLCITAWMVGNFLADNAETNNLLWTRITYLASTLIAPVLLYLARIFPDEKTDSSITSKALIFLPALILTTLLFFTDLLVSGIEKFSWGINVITGRLYFLYPVYFVIYFLIASVILIRKFKASKDIERIQLKYFITGLAISLAIGTLANSIIPFITENYQVSRFGPFGIVFFVVFTTYAILKHHLFNIKVIAAELFSALIVLVSFIRIFTFQSQTELIGNAVLFIAVVIFSFFLVRGVISEVRQREEIQKLNERLNDFISFANHELRAPITTFAGELEMLQDGSYGTFNQKATEAFKSLSAQTQNMRILVDTFLDLNKIEQNKFEVNLQPVQLEDIISECVKGMTTFAGKKSLKLTFNKPQQSLSKVMADPFKIRDVILNLLSNAIKYTNKGSVTVSMIREGNEVITTIEDTGMGIRKEDLNKLFTKYERGGGHAKSTAEGSGIGLYISKKIVDLHHGRIWAESEGEGRGSKFRFGVRVTNLEL